MRKYILKLGEDEFEIVYNTLFYDGPADPDLDEVLKRMRIVKSGIVPEFIEED